jgi:hypothetical protein
LSKVSEIFVDVAACAPTKSNPTMIMAVTAVSVVAPRSRARWGLIERTCPDAVAT